MSQAARLFALEIHPRFIMVCSPSQKTFEGQGLLGSPSGALSLRVLGEEHDGRVIQLNASKCTIGSASDSTLRIRAQGVRACHCLILRGKGGMVVRSWSPGTYLNGRSFQVERLQPGDLIGIGPIQFEVLDAGPAVMEETPLPESSLATEETDQGVLESSLSLSALEMEEERKRLQEQGEKMLQARDLAKRRCRLMLHRLRAEKKHRAKYEEDSRQRTEFTEALEKRLVQLEESLNKRSDTGAETSQSKELAKSLLKNSQDVAVLREQLKREKNRLIEEKEEWSIQKKKLEEELEYYKRHLEEKAGDKEASVGLQKAAPGPFGSWDEEQSTLMGWLDEKHNTTCSQLELQQKFREAEVAALHWREKAQEWEGQIKKLEQHLEEVRQRQAEHEAKAAEHFSNPPPRTSPEIETVDDNRDHSQASLLEAQTGESVSAATVFSSMEKVREESTENQEIIRGIAEDSVTSAASLFSQMVDNTIAFQDPLPLENNPVENIIVDDESNAVVPVQARPETEEREEESIESYMSQLYKRLGVSKSARPQPVRQGVKKPIPCEAAEEESAEELEPAKPLEPSEYVPKSTAPEQVLGIASMREIANAAARFAINKSVSQRGVKEAWGKLVMAGVALVIGLIYWRWTFPPSFASYHFAMAAAFIGSIFWMLQAISLLKPMALGKRIANPVPEKPASAASRISPESNLNLPTLDSEQTES